MATRDDEAGTDSGSHGRGRRRRRDKGLPGEAELIDLAKTYLDAQRRLWPEPAAAGRLPDPTEENAAAYADNFRRRFLGEPALPGPWDYAAPAATLAVAYVRFSSANSDPRSLDQQLGLLLDLARDGNAFVPWTLLFGDSAVTATTAARTGWQLARAALRTPGVAVLYVDDLGRASRDNAESHDVLAELDAMGKRIVGVSDNVDTSQPEGDTVFAVHTLLNSKYIKSLRAKVHRGMTDAFRRGKVVHAPPIGYSLVPKTGADGRPVTDRQGRPEHEVAIHEGHAEVVRDVFRRYAELGHSTVKIAKWLNTIEAGGRRAWGPSQVAGMLDRRVYVGIEVRGMTRQHRDRRTGKITQEKRPRSEWQIRRVPQLRIIPRALWKTARRRRAERASLFPEGSRGRVAAYPTRLLSLVCGRCGAPLVLGKSGAYAQVRCPDAAEGKRGCTFGGYKSLRKIEGPILAFVAERLSDPAYVERLVREANAALDELAKSPQEDVTALEARVRELREAETRLVEAIAMSDTAVAVLTSRLDENRGRLEEARARLADAKAASSAPPAPLTREEVRRMLSNLRGLLDQEAGAAAPVLRELLGDVVVTQEVEPGRQKPVWYAEFRVDGFGAAVRGEVPNGDADLARALSPLSRAMGPAEPARVRLDPPAKPPEAEKPKATPPYVRIAEEAVRLRDERLSFAEIGRRLGVHEVTAMRAYDHARPQERPEKGRKRPQGGKAAQVRRRVAELLTQGRSPAEAAREARCSEMTVRRVIKALRDTTDRTGESEAA